MAFLQDMEDVIHTETEKVSSVFVTQNAKTNTDEEEPSVNNMAKIKDVIKTEGNSTMPNTNAINDKMQLMT